MSEGEQDTGGGLRARLFRRWSSRSEPEPEPGAEPETEPEPDAVESPAEQAERPELGPSLTEMPSPAAPRPPAELPELARDVAALWLAFSQHERALEDLIAEVERIGGQRITAPGGREAAARGSAGEPTRPGGVPQPGPSAGATPAASAIGDQLADLDGILEAIENATRVLGQTQSEELNRGEQEPEAGNGSGVEAEHGSTGTEAEHGSTEAEPEDG